MLEDDPDESLLSHKRRRSVSPSPSPLPARGPGELNRTGDDHETMQRAPKRLRRSHEVPAYDAPVHASGLSSSNPLNRRMVKRAAKKARRAARPKGAAAGIGGGMEIDDVGLAGTFLAGGGPEMAQV